MDRSINIGPSVFRLDDLLWQLKDCPTPVSLTLSLGFVLFSYLLFSEVIFGIQFCFNKEKFTHRTVITPLWTEDRKWWLEL